MDFLVIYILIGVVALALLGWGIYEAYQDHKFVEPPSSKECDGFLDWDIEKDL